MIIGQNFSTQSAMTKLAGGAGGSAKTQQDVKDRHKTAADKLAGGMSGAEKSKEAGKQEGAKKKKGAEQKEQAGLQKFGSEAFAPKEEMPDSDNLKRMDDLRQQAKDFKLKGSFNRSGGGQETSGADTKFSGALKGFKFPKGEGKGKKSLVEDEVESQVGVHSDSGQIQIHTGLTKKGIQKKDSDETSEMQEKQETKKKQETVQDKDGKGSEQGNEGSGNKTLDLQQIKKMERLQKIKHATPKEDAAEATESMKEFQKQTGISTRALKNSSKIAKTIVGETDGAKKAKRTRMRPVKDVKRIVKNEKPAPMQDIQVKNEPLAILPVDGKINSGETELVKTKLPEEKPDSMLDKMESVPVGTSPAVQETKELSGPKTITHVSSQNFTLNHSAPESVSEKGKEAFKDGYGVELKGESRFYQSEAGTIIVDNIGDGKGASVPQANLFDGNEHKVIQVGEKGGTIYTATPDKDNPNVVRLAGTGVPAGDEWYGTVTRSTADGKETFRTEVFGKPTDQGQMHMTTESKISGSKEETRMDIFQIAPRQAEAAPQTAGQQQAAPPQDFISQGQFSKAEKVPRNAQIRGTVRDEMDIASTVHIGSRSTDRIGQVQIGTNKNLFIDGVDPETAKTKSKNDILFDGKVHTMVVNEDSQMQQGPFSANTVLKLTPDKGNPDRVTFTGRYENTMFGGKGFNVVGEGIRSKDADGKEKVEYRYSVVDPQTNQVVFSGRGDELPTGENTVVNRGQMFQGPIPGEDMPGQPYHQEKSSSKSSTWQPASEEYAAATFLKRDSGLADFTEGEQEKGVSAAGGSSGAQT